MSLRFSNDFGRVAPVNSGSESFDLLKSRLFNASSTDVSLPVSIAVKGGADVTRLVRLRSATAVSLTSLPVCLQFGRSAAD